MILNVRSTAWTVLLLDGIECAKAEWNSVFKIKHGTSSFAEISVEVSGATFNHMLSMKTHENAIAKLCFHYLRNIARIYRLISDGECKIIVHTFVISRLDYCSVLLCGLSNSISQISWTQNYVAHMVVRFDKSEHVTLIVHDLHWFFIGLRILLSTFIEGCRAIFKYNNNNKHGCGFWTMWLVIV